MDLGVKHSERSGEGGGVSAHVHFGERVDCERDNAGRWVDFDGIFFGLFERLGVLEPRYSGIFGEVRDDAEESAATDKLLWNDRLSEVENHILHWWHWWWWRRWWRLNFQFGSTLSTRIVGGDLSRILVSWTVESEGSNTANGDDFNTLIVSIKLFAVEEPLEVRLSPTVDGIELDDASEFNVLSSVWNIDLVFDDLVEEDWNHSVNANVCADFSAETATVVLSDIFVLDVMDDEGSSAALADDFVFSVFDVFFCDFDLALGGDLLPLDNGAMLGQVAMKDNSVALVGKGVAEVFDESNRGDSVNTQISSRAEAVVSTDTVDNAGIFVVNVVNDEHSDSASGDDVELASWLDLCLFPVTKEPVDFGCLVLDFA